MGSLIFDFRDALRALRRSPAYLTTVILTLALTIGTTTAVFSMVNGVLLKPLPYREPDRLVALREVWRQFSKLYPTVPVNQQHFEYWRAHARSLESLAQYVLQPGNLTGSGDAAQVTVVRTSGSLFEVLRVRASTGRMLTREDERSDRPDVVVITDALWRARFDADAGKIGHPIVIDGKPYTIVGVLPPDFRLPRSGELTTNVDAFVPLRVESEQVGWVGDHNNEAIGRLAAGVTLDQAQAELNLLQSQVSERATNEAHEPVTLGSLVAPLAETVVGGTRRGLMLLLAAIVAVLLIACSNLANLSLTRTIGRLREVAIRSALGASRLRLLGPAVVEQLVLSMSGGALGLWVAWAALMVFVRTAPVELPRVSDVTLDGHVLGFAAAVSLAAALLIAVLPAWRVAGRDVQAALRAGGNAATSDRGGTRMRATLLALQVGLSVTLIVVTALLGISFVRLTSIDRGFIAERVIAVNVALPATRYAEEPVRRSAYDRMLAGIRALPGIEAVTTTSLVPLSGDAQVNFIVADGDSRPRSDHATANFRFIAPDFFRTLGITVLRGRSFADTERDPHRPAPALISERTAARLWPGEDPIGKRFSRGIAEEQGFEIVGVVPDARTTSIERTPPLMVYAPYWWRSRPSTALLIKSAIDPASLMTGVRRAISGIDPEIALGQSRPLDEIVNQSLAARRYQLRLFLAFGLAALSTAIIGVYSVTAYGVSRRRREMHIRVALGARPSQAVSLIVRQASLAILAGIIAGGLAALALGRVVSSLLFDVGAHDPLVLCSVVAVVGGVGLLTSFGAARRGLTANSFAAFREE